MSERTNAVIILVILEIATLCIWGLYQAISIFNTFLTTLIL